MTTIKYNPMIHGAVTAIHIWLDNGYKPMAELAFAFGGTKVINWDNVSERKKYKDGITAYTIMYDERAESVPFENYVIVKE